MIEKVREIYRKWEMDGQRLYQPEVLNDNALYTELLKEYKNLTPIAEKYKEYVKVQNSLKDAEEIIADGSDLELAEMAKLEREEDRELILRYEEELKILLIPKDPDEDKSAIVEIRAGTGGEEAALFAADLYRMYQYYAQGKNWTTETIYENETELGGYKEVSFSVEGQGVFGRLRYESGTHRVQRIPVTDSNGKIQTSAATVAVLPEAEEVEFELDPKDIQIDVFRSSGAGGQKVNKTSSAIRVTYLPTGMVVECQDERSQYKNKDKALKVLRSRLYEEKKQAADKQRADERKSQVGSGDRSERIRTYNFPQSRVTDHRIGLTLNKLESVMAGDLDGIIDALRADEMAQKLSKEEDI